MQNENSGDVLALILGGIDQIDSAHILMKCPAHVGAFTSSLEVTLKAGLLSMQCMCGCTQDRILATALGEKPQHQRSAVEAFIDSLDIA
ncbi:MAG: hypothetical protein B7X31_01935 [Thiomonas sp. 13-66-29]|jgi:hypothetical protein|nr:MAG: hypothetical protein B7X31_01935 [Thiomonas sp. 13-66-29]